MHRSRKPAEIASLARVLRDWKCGSNTIIYDGQKTTWLQGAEQLGKGVRAIGNLPKDSYQNHAIEVMSKELAVFLVIPNGVGDVLIHVTASKR
jgi:hypothetical protein